MSFGLALIGNAVLVRVINKSTKHHDLVKTVFQFCLELQGRIQDFF